MKTSENKIKIVEKNLPSNESKEGYLKCNCDLNDQKIEGVKI